VYRLGIKEKLDKKFKKLQRKDKEMRPKAPETYLMIIINLSLELLPSSLFSTQQTKQIYPACPACPMKRFCYFIGVAKAYGVKCDLPCGV
jgi:hypothetical protein